MFTGFPLKAKVQIFFIQKKIILKHDISMNISGLRIGSQPFTGFINTLSKDLSAHNHRICRNTLTGFVTTHSQDLSQYIHRIGHNTFRGFFTTHSLSLSPRIHRISSCNHSLINPFSHFSNHISLTYVALISIGFHSICHHTLTGSHGIITDPV